MSTLLLSSQCDSVVTKICGGLIPVVKETYEAGTSENDVYIVAIICATIVVVAWIAKKVILSWKNQDFQEKENEREEKRNKEKEDSIRKQKADCQGKLFDFLEKQVSSFDIQKKEYEKASEDYKDFLLTILNSDTQQKNTLKDELREELRSYLENQIKKYDKQKEEYDKACECYKKELKDLIEKMK